MTQVHCYTWHELEIAKKLLKSSQRPEPKTDHSGILKEQAYNRYLCWIYMISALDGEVVKIGRALDVKDRFSTLQIGSPVPLKFWTAVMMHEKTETRLHKWLKELNYQGEWFFCEEPVWELRATMELEGPKGIEQLLERNGF